MMRACACLLFVVMGLTVLPGCGSGGPPEPLSADEEQQFEQQLQEAQRAEGAAQAE